MTVHALFSDVGMLVNKWPLVLHVAAGAKGFAGNAFEAVAVGRKVWIVTVSAGHLVFGDRVMRELSEFHLSLRVATGAEFFLLMTVDFLLWPFV